MVKSSQRRALHVPATRKTEMLNRLRSARGHLDAVIRMVEGEAYCVDVVKQISAIRAALDRVGRMELRNHFEQCFAEAIRTGEDERAIDELMEALAFNKELV
ncbi:transcriptional regulator [bacterium]|nr:MAG: transcriptional regulator [bacterium]